MYKPHDGRGKRFWEEYDAFHDGILSDLALRKARIKLMISLLSLIERKVELKP